MAKICFNKRKTQMPLREAMLAFADAVLKRTVDNASAIVDYSVGGANDATVS